MQNKVQLYIENQRVDLFNDETIEVTSTIQDFRDIGKVFTDFSMPFTLPASSTNNKIFRHFYNYNITDGAFDSRKKKEAFIEINHLPFREGKIYLNSVDMRNNKPYTYEIIFYGKTVSLKDLLGDDELTDLDLSDYNHEYTDTNVKNGFADGLDLNSQDNSVIYPLITSKKRLFFNSDLDADIHFNSTGNLYHDSINGADTDRGLEFTDLKPAIRVMHIIEAIESKYGISFTRDFFTAELDEGTPKNPAFYNLYLWLNNVKDEFDNQDGVKLFEHQAKSSEYSLNTTYTGDGAFLNQAISEVTFEDDIIEITKSAGNDEYKIAFRALYSNQGEFDIVFTELDSDGNEIAEFVTKPGNVEFTTDDGFFIGFYTAFESSSSAGTRRFKAKIKTSKFTFLTPILHVIKDSGGTPAVEAYDKSDFAISFDINLGGQNGEYLIPEMKVIDFLTGLFKIFNLTAYFIDDKSDVNYGKIYVDTLDNFYADATNNKLTSTINLDKYVDISEHTVNSILPFSDIHFKYKENSSLLMRQHEEAFGEIFGDAEFNVREGTKDPNTGEYKIDRGTKYDIDVPFAHMKYERLINQAELNNASDRTDKTEIQWGYSAGGDFDADTSVTPPTGDYDSLNIKPLLFYAIRETNLPTPDPATNDNTDGRINWIQEGGTASYVDSYWRPSNSNEEGTASTAPSHTLNFDIEFDEWQGINYGENSNSLYKVFYKNYVEGIFNPLRRVFKVTAHLPASIIVNYKLNHQIRLGDKIFRINSVSVNLVTGKSEFELYNIFEDDIV